MPPNPKRLSSHDHHKKRYIYRLTMHWPFEEWPCDNIYQPVVVAAITHHSPWQPLMDAQLPLTVRAMTWARSKG